MRDLDWQLCDAVVDDNIAEVRRLLGRGASVNYKDSCNMYNFYELQGGTLLHRAVTKGNVEIAELLIRNKADVNAHDNLGVTPLHEAAKMGYVEIAELLIKNKANAPDNVGATPLHEAANEGYVKIAELLIRNKADVNAPDNVGDTPLHKGTNSYHYQENMVMMVESLIRQGAHVSVSNNKGATPLHNVAERGNVEVANLLIRNKADVNAPDNVGATPLHSAAKGGNVEVTDLLIRNKAGVNDPDNDRATPLHSAAKGGNVEVIDQLVRNKADVNAPDKDGDSPLHEAAKQGNEFVVKTLLSAGAKVSAQNNKNQTPLHVVKYKEDAEILIRYGADVNSRDINNQTPLHVVKYKEGAEILIRYGADVNSRDINGDSPLHEAASQGKESVVKTLLSAGAIVSARNNKGTTPYELAEKGNQKNKGDFISANKYNKTLNYLEDALEPQTLPDKKHEEYSKQFNFPKAGPYKQKIEKDIKLPWLVDADEFQRMLSHGEYLSYENRLSLGGPCRAGKSTLASVLIDEEIPLKWNSTDGLVIFFGRNGIDIKNKKMVPLKKGERGHEVYAKILRGKPDFCKSPDLKKRQQILALEETGQAFYLELATPVSTVQYTQRDDASGHHSTVKVADKTSDYSIKPLPGHLEPQVTSSSLSTVATEPEPLEFQKLQLQSSILDEVRNRKYKIDIAPSDLIDFGGQKSYDMTHQLFIQHKGSFLLMFDGRYGLHNQLKDYPDGVTAASILKHWVDSILTYTADTDEQMPMILFAATHRDKCEGDTKKIKECFLADLKEMLSSHEKKNHIHLDTLYFINGVDKTDVEIQRMTDQIVIFAMRQTSWGQRRPMQWVPLELQISNMKMKNVNILTKANLQQVNELNADLALNEKQMDDFLLVQHSLGKLMYYNLPGLDKFIIIYPPALVNILRSFVTDEMFFPKDENLKHILQQMRKTGKIYKTDLLMLWEQEHFNNYMPEETTKEFVIQLLIHLDILIIPKSLESRYSTSEIYLVPCMIKAMKPPNFNSYNIQGKNTICLRYSLDSQSLPTALAFKMIGAVISVWPVKEDENHICLYHKAVVLNVVGNNELRIWIEDNRVCVYMTNQNGLISISQDIAASVQECLTWNLELSILFMYNSIGNKIKPTQVLRMYSMEVGIPCGSGVCYRSVRDDMHEKNWVCNNGETHSTRHISYWIFDRKQETCNSKCEGLTTDELALDLNDTHLIRLGRQLDFSQFKRVVANLGMHKTEWEEIEYTYKGHGLRGMKGMTLIKWKQARLDDGEKATIKHLSDSIIASDVDNHFICQIFREKSNLLGDGHVHLQKSPTDKVLKELSNHIGNCALELSLELGLGLPKTEHILQKTSADIPQLIEEILIKWKRNSKQTTARSLMMSLQRVGTGGCFYLRGIIEDSTKFEEVSLSKEIYEKTINQRGLPFEGNYNIEETYESRKDQQGLALIVNYSVKREGSQNDVQRLERFFRDTLGYNVKCEQDLTKSQLMDTINVIKTGEMMGKAGIKYHCFVFVIMCHGIKDKLCLSGEDTTTVRDIVDKFKLKDFAGKPKFFVFQACREGEKQSFIHAADNADASSQLYDDSELHRDSDILISFATTPGNKAFRKIPHEANPWVGSWFVHALLDVFEKQYKHKDVMKMLEQVRRKFNTDEQYSLTTGKGQMSEDVSTLSKTFFM